MRKGVNFMKRKLFLRGLALASAFILSGSLFSLVGCGDQGDNPPDTGDPSNPNEPGNPSETVVGKEGWYVLTEKTVQGVSVKHEYLYNCIYLKDDTANWYEIDYAGMSERKGDYTVSENTLTIGIGIREYAFSFDTATSSMTYSGKINKQNTVMTYQYDKDFVLPVTEEGVEFTDELFGQDKNGNYYNYCPTVMMEGNDTMHVWYCSNRVSGNVTDYVAYRKGTLNAAGKWKFSDIEFVLAPTAGTWDARHTCDPSVTKGTFRMGGEDYSFLMAYLGCVTSDNTQNEVGIAVAKSPAGPWVKVDSLNPIANFYTSPEHSANAWGYGQPCVMNPEGEGKVYLFYAKGTATKTCTQIEEWDLSDLDRPVKVRSAELKEKNVVNASGGSDNINNADLAYDAVNKRLYCLKEDFPYPTDQGINWLTGSNTLLYVQLDESGFDVFFGNTSYSWNKVGSLTASGLGFARVHNMGILTDEYGNLTSPFRVPVLYTACEAYTDYPGWSGGGQWPALHTYRFHGYVFEIK